MHTIQERSCNSAFVLPRNCTFSETDGKALAPFWYPIAFSHEVTDRLFAAKVLDERLVLFRLSDSSIVAARDLCLHRGVPLSSGWVENDAPMQISRPGLRQKRSMHAYSRSTGCRNSRSAEIDDLRCHQTLWFSVGKARA